MARGGGGAWCSHGPTGEGVVGRGIPVVLGGQLCCGNNTIPATRLSRPHGNAMRRHVNVYNPNT